MMGVRYAGRCVVDELKRGQQVVDLQREVLEDQVLRLRAHRQQALAQVQLSRGQQVAG